MFCVSGIRPGSIGAEGDKSAAAISNSQNKRNATADRSVAYQTDLKGNPSVSHYLALVSGVHGLPAFPLPSLFTARKTTLD